MKHTVSQAVTSYRRPQRFLAGLPCYCRVHSVKPTHRSQQNRAEAAAGVACLRAWHSSTAVARIRPRRLSLNSRRVCARERMAALSGTPASATATAALSSAAAAAAPWSFQKPKSQAPTTCLFVANREVYQVRDALLSIADTVSQQDVVAFVVSPHSQKKKQKKKQQEPQTKKSKKQDKKDKDQAPRTEKQCYIVFRSVECAQEAKPLLQQKLDSLPRQGLQAAAPDEAQTQPNSPAVILFATATSSDAQQEQQEESKSKEAPSKEAVRSSSVKVDSVGPDVLEQVHVRQFYDQIATHFDHTRHTPWPRVEKYVRSLPTGSTLADIGCGNGRYLSLNTGLARAVGCDFSQRLVDICTAKGLAVVCADAKAVPYDSSSFDTVISIAVLHHFASLEHRLAVIRELLRIVKSGGEVYVSAWAFEQGDDSRRQFDSQDVMVPWHLPLRFVPQAQAQAQTHAKETEAAAPAAPAAPAAEEHKIQETTSATAAADVQLSGVADEARGTIRYDRFCHVFKQGELEELFYTCARDMSHSSGSSGSGNGSEAGQSASSSSLSVQVVESLYDASNWCVRVKVQKKELNE